MLLHIINYAVRGLIIIVGIILISGVMIPDSNENKYLTQVMGAVFIIWGVYRIVLYKTQYKKYHRNRERENHDI